MAREPRLASETLKLESSLALGVSLERQHQVISAAPGGGSATSSGVHSTELRGNGFGFWGGLCSITTRTQAQNQVHGKDRGIQMVTTEVWASVLTPECLGFYRGNRLSPVENPRGNNVAAVYDSCGQVRPAGLQRLGERGRKSQQLLM